MIGVLAYRGPFYAEQANDEAHGHLGGFACAPAIAAGVHVRPLEFGVRLTVIDASSLSPAPHIYAVEQDHLFATSVDAFTRWYPLPTAHGFWLEGGLGVYHADIFTSGVETILGLNPT